MGAPSPFSSHSRLERVFAVLRMSRSGDKAGHSPVVLAASLVSDAAGSLKDESDVGLARTPIPGTKTELAASPDVDLGALYDAVVGALAEVRV